MGNVWNSVRLKVEKKKKRQGIIETATSNSNLQQLTVYLTILGVPY